MENLNNLPQLTDATEINNVIDKIIPRGDFSIHDIEAVKPTLQLMEPHDVYLEVGSRFGKSLTVAAILAPEAEIYGVDIEDPAGRKQYFDAIGLTKRGVTFCHGDSVDIARRWAANIISIHVLLIDGDHSYEGVTRDIDAWIPYLVSGGWILFHDYDITSPGVIKAVDEYVRDSGDYADFFTAVNKYGLKSSIAGARKI